MLKNLFNKGTKEVEQNVAAPAIQTPVMSTPNRAKKPSPKKKNTYIVTLNTCIQSGMHASCSHTPLAVVEINGVPTENTNKGWMSTTEFPNPGASQIEVLYHRAPEWRIILGDRMAQTIIEYLDKETLKPVLMVYPNGSVQSLISGMDVNTVVSRRLNHASRRDFVRQYKRIADKAEIVDSLIGVRNRAMEHAPRYTPTAFSEFVLELNRQQIAQAKEIMAQRRQK